MKDKNFERQNRIGEALAFRGLKQADLISATGFPSSSMSSWINQKYQPKYKAIAKMAKVLNVSEMWLAGYDAPIERPAIQIKNERIAQIVGKMREDDKFTRLVFDMMSLSEDKLLLIENIVNEFIKTEEQ